MQASGEGETKGVRAAHLERAVELLKCELCAPSIIHSEAHLLSRARLYGIGPRVMKQAATRLGIVFEQHVNPRTGLSQRTLEASVRSPIHAFVVNWQKIPITLIACAFHVGPTSNILQPDTRELNMCLMSHGGQDRFSAASNSRNRRSYVRQCIPLGLSGKSPPGCPPNFTLIACARPRARL